MGSRKRRKRAGSGGPPRDSQPRGLDLQTNAGTGDVHPVAKGPPQVLLQGLLCVCLAVDEEETVGLPGDLLGPVD